MKNFFKFDFHHIPKLSIGFKWLIDLNSFFYSGKESIEDRLLSRASKLFLGTAIVELSQEMIV